MAEAQARGDSFTELHIRGFRRLQHVELEMRPLAEVIGTNGSAKTSLLEAWSFVVAAARGRLAARVSEAGGLRDVVTRGPSDSVSLGVSISAGRGRSMRYDLQLELAVGSPYCIRSEALVRECPPSGDSLKLIEARGADVSYLNSTTGEVVRPHWEGSPLETALSQVQESFPELATLRRRIASCEPYGALDVGKTSPIRIPQLMAPRNLPGLQGEGLVPCLYHLREAEYGRFEALHDTIQTAFPDFEGLDFAPVTGGLLTMTWKERHFSKPLSMQDLSEGTLRFLWLATLLQSRDLPAVTPMDQPEMSLHPDQLRLLADLMRAASRRTQLMVATQSDRLIRFLEPAEVLLVDVEDGLAYLRWSVTLHLEAWLADYTLDELWHMGRLGSRS